jgi:pimeloyl-ACP methyl ester carboxylesterase
MSPAQQAGILAVGRFDASAGLVLTADVGGDPSGQPVLLLHGGGQTRHSWGRAAIELAAQGYYAVALDLRGHGDSDWAADADYTLDAHIADIRAVIRGLSRPPALIGASMGGLISLSVAGESPDLPIRCLVLVDVTPRVDAAGRARILGFMRERPDGFASIEEAADAIAAYLPHRPRPKDLSGLHRNLRRGADGRWHWHWDPRFFDTFEPDHEIAAQRYTAAARRVGAPTLLVRGSKSELVTPDSVRHFRESIPHAEYVDVADAAHMIAGDRNDLFNAVVLEFLRRRAPPD